MQAPKNRDSGIRRYPLQIRSNHTTSDTLLLSRRRLFYGVKSCIEIIHARMNHCNFPEPDWLVTDGLQESFKCRFCLINLTEVVQCQGRTEQPKILILNLIEPHDRFFWLVRE